MNESPRPPARPHEGIILKDLLLWPARWLVRAGRIAVGLFEPTIEKELQRERR